VQYLSSAIITRYLAKGGDNRTAFCHTLIRSIGTQHIGLIGNGECGREYLKVLFAKRAPVGWD